MPLGRPLTTPPGAPGPAAAAAAGRLAAVTGADRHEVAVVLGSGWSPAADALGPASAAFPVTDLPGFAPPAVPGHPGEVRSVEADGRRVLIFLGRTHLYEGHGVDAVVHGVRTAVAAGARVVVLTNAAGALSAGLEVGRPVLISDQLNLTGRSPLTGPCFVDLSDLYAARLRMLAGHEHRRLTGAGPPAGVYAAMAGPQFETPAEIVMLRAAGADLVGMSTALEAIAARAAGAEVLGISLVTNPAAGLSAGPLDHGQVTAAGTAAAGRLGPLLAAVVARV